MIQITGLSQLLTPNTILQSDNIIKIVWGKYKCKQGEMWQ